MKRTISLIAILALSLSLFSGCKKPPTQELAVEAVYPKASRLSVAFATDNLLAAYKLHI